MPFKKVKSDVGIASQLNNCSVVEIEDCAHFHHHGNQVLSAFYNAQCTKGTNNRKILYKMMQTDGTDTNTVQ